MKKFTSLFLLFLVCFVHNLGAQTAAATLPTFSQANGAKHYYKIKNVRSQKYAQYKGDATQLGQTASNALTADNLFYFIEVTDASLSGNNKKSKIGAFSTDKFCAETSSFTAQGRDWYLIPKTVGNDSGFAISKTATGSAQTDAWDDQGRQTSIGYWNVGEPGTMWVFEAMTDSEATTFFNSAKNVYKEHAKRMTYDLTAKTYTDLLTSIDQVTVTNAADFETKKMALEKLVTDYATSLPALYIQLSNNTYNNTVFYMAGTDANPVTIADKATTKTYWRLAVSADKKHLSFYNPYHKKYIGSLPNRDNVATPWANTAETAGQFLFYRAAENENFVVFEDVNQSGNHDALHHSGQRTLVRWETSSPASKWTLTDLKLTEQEVNQKVAAEIEALPRQNIIDAMTAKATFWQERVDANSIKTEGTPGYHLVGFTDYSTWNAFLNEVKQSKTTETLQALQEKQNKLNASLVANDVTGKFYRLACASRSKGHIAYAEPYYSTNAITGDNPDGIDARGLWYDTVPNVRPAAALWTLEVATDEADRYYVKNVNSNMYVSRINSIQHTDMPVSKDWAGKFFLGKYTHTAETNDWNLSDHINNGTFLSTDNQSKKVNAWTSAQDVGAGWIFEEVTTFPVTIGNAKYATLNLPFAVEIADKANLNAYIGQKTANTNEFKVTKITDGIIPANTPVILHGAAGTYTLDITTKQGNVNQQANELKGTTIANHKMEKNTYYGLGVLKNNTVGFKLANTTDMAANKAYLPKPAGAQAAALSFVFEGQQTGINGVTTEEVESNVYYDLNGRRVLYPTTGLYINAKGQKVFLK